jgi:tetratricopeptide (TPR) repeat protein
VPGAEADVKELTQLVADREKRARKDGYDVSKEKATDLREAEGWLACAKGKPDEALQELRAAADHQDKEGGESVGVPAREMLADMLMELKRTVEALAEYKIVLKNSPNRFDALFGAIRAAASIHSPAAQAELEVYFNQLMSCCGFGGDRPEIKALVRYTPGQELEVLLSGYE